MPAIEPPERRPSRKGTFDMAAIERLEDLLETQVLPHGGLPLESIDGLFCAALVAPGEAVSFEELLPVALGPEASPEDARLAETIELLRGMWAMIARRIAEPVTRATMEQSLPLLSLPEMDEQGRPLEDDEDIDFPFGAPWALGFMLGFQLRGEEWTQWLEEDEALADGVYGIFDLLPPELAQDEEQGEGGEDPAGDDEDRDDYDDEPVTLEDRMEILADLPALLNELHTARVERLVSRVPVRRIPEPGRNDPCPCGSGLKYKRCHGDPNHPKH